MMNLLNLILIEWGKTNDVTIRDPVQGHVISETGSFVLREGKWKSPYDGFLPSGWVESKVPQPAFETHMRSLYTQITYFEGLEGKTQMVYNNPMKGKFYMLPILFCIYLQ